MNDNEWPLISIVIPVYNSEKYLPETLDSILRQTYKNFEIILVDNASKGNVGEIFSEYENAYPEVKWKLVRFEENQGVFHARLAGWKVMTGDYFTSIDSDDVMSVDFYYQLMKQALDTDSDIVIAEYVNDFVGDSMKHYALNPMELSDICWENGEGLRHYMEFHGGCFNLHAVWAKLFKRSVFEKSRPYLERVKPQLILSEDVLSAAVFYAFSKKVTNIHHVYYYHTIRQDAESLNVGASVAKIENAFRNQYDAFNELERFLRSINRSEELKKDIEIFRIRFVGLIFSGLRDGNIPDWEKKRIQNSALKMFQLKEPVYLLSEDWLFESRHSPFNDMRERALRQIMDESIQCVSFDIFDTLIERPFFRPDDMFEFLAREYNRLYGGSLYVSFAQLRRDAERVARDKVRLKYPAYAEVTLQEIYEELKESGVLTEDQAAVLMQKEIDFELRFCKRRQVGYDLYDFARRCGKKVICISDMYLPGDVIRQILEKNGYTDIDALFVSSEERVCKYDQQIYKAALKELGLKPAVVAHFGDNYLSDCIAARGAGVTAPEENTYVASARELMTGTCGATYTGNLFTKMFGVPEDSFSPQNYLGTRCLLGVAQNRVFSNPYVCYSRDSSFDANPIYLGYFALGMYVFAVAKWLMERTRERGYGTIHFIARDGYLIKQAYDAMTARAKGKYPRSNYLYTSRYAMMPMMISCEADIYALSSMMDICAYTPCELLDDLRDIIPPEAFARREAILKGAHIFGSHKFRSWDEWPAFAKVFLENFYDAKTIQAYRKAMKDQFSAIIGPHDCTFDVGYSARTEAVFTELLGYPLDAFYLFCCEARGPRQAHNSGFYLESFHKNVLDIRAMPVLESLISTTDPSCRGYTLKNGKLGYRFGKLPFEFQTRFFLDLIHQEALRFVSDLLNTFPDEWEDLQYRYAERPFMCLMTCSTWFDHGLLLAARFEDSQSTLKEKTLMDSWNAIGQFDTVSRSGGDGIVYVSAPPQYGPRWKKAVYYLMYDRKTLKDKVKDKFHDHPALLVLMRTCYSIPRGIYHMFRR